MLFFFHWYARATPPAWWALNKRTPLRAGGWTDFTTSVSDLDRTTLVSDVPGGV